MDRNFRSSLDSLQVLLKYNFKDISLLEEALTHPSYINHPSYQRLEFLGDAILGLALATFIFVSYRDHGPGDLTLLRSANINTEKFARVAVRHGLFQYVRHSSPILNDIVVKFSEALQEEGDETLSCRGRVKAPKVLADIVESIAGALYEDCNFDLKFFWEHFSPLLDPIITMENLTQQPVTVLTDLCQTRGRDLKFMHWQEGTKIVTDVFVDGVLWGSATSKNKEISQLGAAKIALEKLRLEPAGEGFGDCEMADVDADAEEEIVGAKKKLHEYCKTNKNECFSKPRYRILEEDSSSHDKMFICCVRIASSEGVKETTGDRKPIVKDAESSAASKMLRILNDVH